MTSHRYGRRATLAPFTFQNVWHFRLLCPTTPSPLGHRVFSHQTEHMPQKEYSFTFSRSSDSSLFAFTLTHSLKSKTCCQLGKIICLRVRILHLKRTVTFFFVTCAFARLNLTILIKFRQFFPCISTRLHSTTYSVYHVLDCCSTPAPLPNMCFANEFPCLGSPSPSERNRTTEKQRDFYFLRNPFEDPVKKQLCSSCVSSFSLDSCVGAPRHLQGCKLTPALHIHFVLSCPTW